MPSSTEYDYEITQGLYDLYLNSDISSGYSVAFATKGGAGYRSQLQGLAYYDVENKTYQIIESPKSVNCINEGPSLYYMNVFAGIDMQYI